MEFKPKTKLQSLFFYLFVMCAIKLMKKSMFILKNFNQIIKELRLKFIESVKQ